MQAIDELILRSRAFAGLEPRHLTLIAACGMLRRYLPDELLFREGGPASSFFLIRHGSVALEVAVPGREPLVIETLHDGELVGWSWLFEPYRWHFDARANEPLAVVELDGSCLRGKCEEDHELGYQLMRRFAGALIDRLQHTRLQLLDVYGHLPVA